MNDVLKRIYEGGLPKGYYTLGDGHIHKVPTTGYSKWYERGDYKFRFNNATQQIEAYYMDELFDSMDLSFMNWIENPDYWVDYYMKELEDTAEYENIYGESTKLQEDQSYVIAYREGGQDKYSSVQAQSSSDALRIFNALIDKSGRHVNNAHIAIEDVDLSEETGLPPLQTWKVIRKFDDDEVELATLKARNKDEANATMLMALLDAGYYEGEVAPEISNGSIYVVKECKDLNEDANQKLFKVEYHYHYEDEIDEYPYARSATYIDWKLVLADSSEDAIDKVMSHITEIANETPGMVGDPYDFEVVNVWDSLESYKKAYPYSNAEILGESIKEATDKKLFKVEYHYQYEDEVDEYPYARSATFIGSRLVSAGTPEEAISKLESHSNDIMNETPGMVGDPYDFTVVGVWDSLESYKKAYPYSNAEVLGESINESASPNVNEYSFYINIDAETPNPEFMHGLKNMAYKEGILPVYVTAKLKPDGTPYRSSYGWIFLCNSISDSDVLRKIAHDLSIIVHVSEPYEFNPSLFRIGEVWPLRR